MIMLIHFYNIQIMYQLRHCVLFSKVEDTY